MDSAPIQDFGELEPKESLLPHSDDSNSQFDEVKTGTADQRPLFDEQMPEVKLNNEPKHYCDAVQDAINSNWKIDNESETDNSTADTNELVTNPQNDNVQQLNVTEDTSFQASTMNSSKSSVYEPLPEELKGIDDKQKSNVIRGFCNYMLTLLQETIPSTSRLNTNNQVYYRKSKKENELLISIPPEDKNAIIKFFEGKEIFDEFLDYVLSKIPNDHRKQNAISQIAEALAAKQVQNIKGLREVVSGFLPKKKGKKMKKDEEGNKQKKKRSALSEAEVNVFLHFACNMQVLPDSQDKYRALLQRALVAWWDNVCQNTMLSIEDDVLKEINKMLENHEKTVLNYLSTLQLTENLSLEDQRDFIGERMA